MENKLVDTKTAAEMLCCSPLTLRTQHCRGCLPLLLAPVKIGKRLLWPVAQIEALMAFGGGSDERVKEASKLRRENSPLRGEYAARVAKRAKRAIHEPI